MSNSTDMQKSIVSFSSNLGWMAVEMNPEGIERLYFGHKTESDVLQKMTKEPNLSRSTPPEWWQNAQKLLVEYAAGESVDLSKIPIKTDQRTPFQQKVINALLQVGYGQTITYGELAKRAGRPGAARAVGSHMSKNCVPLIIPCHRVVAAGGKLGGFSASQGVRMKRRLLAMEQPQLMDAPTLQYLK